jgi:hypothetical protein
MGGTALLAAMVGDALYARAMARTMAGDWRDPDQVDRWADAIAATLLPGSVAR